ncbi:uncharacterized protein LOC128396940 isoform X2 [Panonychus citri]|uniref:uncharacterized protein LOC128396940 isoform X2 n=1 Tax=Panonychus citri TaxID=50023 RepID=UPI002307EC19|nr:uncharacterized protein LOC128396940 isoform X2 [Panonychus citri]
MIPKEIVLTLILISYLIVITNCQGAYDPFQSYGGEKKGSFNPSEITAIVVGSFAGLCALGVTFFFCYYVYHHDHKHSHLGGGDGGGRYSPPGYRRP